MIPLERARSKVLGTEAEPRRQESALARLRLEVPLQIEIARHSLAPAPETFGQPLKLRIYGVLAWFVRHSYDLLQIVVSARHRED